MVKPRKKKTNKGVRFSNNIEIVREWELLIMGERKEEEEEEEEEEEVVPKNI